MLQPLPNITEKHQNITIVVSTNNNSYRVCVQGHSLLCMEAEANRRADDFKHASYSHAGLDSGLYSSEYAYYREDLNKWNISQFL